MIKEYIKGLIKLPFYFLGDLIYFLAYFIPKKKNLWLIGSWVGEKYNDNSRHFFEFLLSEKPKDIQFFWITKNKKIISELKKNDIPVINSHSLKGIWLTLRAKVLIMSSNLLDINYKFLITDNQIKIQLWHGIPLKKIGYDANLGLGLKVQDILKYIFPFYYKYRYDLIPVTSNLMRERVSTGLRIEKTKLPILGLPRTDIFFKEKKESKKTAILFAPTFRRQGLVDFPPYLPDKKYLEKIDLLMEKIDGVFKIKLHYLDEKFLRRIKTANLKRVVFIDADPLYDLQRELLNTDILITDYSSIYFDFLLLDRPVIFSAFDVEYYTTKDQGLYEDFENIAAGYVAKNWEEILKFIPEAIEKDEFSEKRKEVKLRYWDKRVIDSSACLRIFEKIKELAGI